MRNICVVTGTRAEYSLLKPVFKAIKSHPKLKLQLLVTGMHLSKKFGYSINQIKKDGFKIDAIVRMHPRQDTGKSMAEAVGHGVIGLSGKLIQLKPDMVVILGDRIEALATAISSAYLNIPIAHIHGGDKSMAGLDESVRHAITKLSYIHLAATKKSAKRIIKMGEEKWRVFTVGSPGINNIKKQKVYNTKEWFKKFKLAQPYIVLLQHPVTTQIKSASYQINETIKAIKDLQIFTAVIYPNSDAGGLQIIKEIDKLKGNPQFRIFKNLEDKEFYSLLFHSSALVGNSSCGIIESPFFGTPVVNIGIRQNGRERSSNIIDVSHNYLKIKDAIKKSIIHGHYLNLYNPYNLPNTDKNIARILAHTPLKKNLIQKTITY